MAHVALECLHDLLGHGAAGVPLRQPPALHLCLQMRNHSAQGAAEAGHCGAEASHVPTLVLHHRHRQADKGRRTRAVARQQRGQQASGAVGAAVPAQQGAEGLAAALRQLRQKCGAACIRQLVAHGPAELDEHLGGGCFLLSELEQAERARDVAGIKAALGRSQERARQAPQPLAAPQLLQALLLVAVKPAV